MYLLLMMMMTIFGLLMVSLAGFLPPTPAFGFLKLALMGLGFLLPFVGILMMTGRMSKVGIISLLNPAKPNEVIWFYIRKDGTVLITPAFRALEGMTKNPKMSRDLIEGGKRLAPMVQDLKSYRLFDHQVRFVPEDIGHTVDHRHVLYAKVLKNKYGFENIRDGRRKIIADEEYKRMEVGKDG